MAQEGFVILICNGLSKGKNNNDEQGIAALADQEKGHCRALCCVCSSGGSISHKSISANSKSLPCRACLQHEAVLCIRVPILLL